MSGEIISIEPRLPPAVCGTSTYGLMLSRHWPHSESRPRFLHLVVDGAEASRRELGTADIHEVGRCASNLLSQMEEFPDAGVIVHYSSRGFHRFGIPLWLSRGLSRWRKRNPDARMLAFYHEVPQPLAMTSRHYILERINRTIIRRIARAANVIATNTREHATRLEEITWRRGVPCVPVPSNIPAPDHADGSFASRAAKDFAVFGLPFTQLLTLRYFEPELADWCKSGVIERLHLIGPTDEKCAPQIDALLGRIFPPEAVIRHGTLPVDRVSEILSRVGFCLTQSNEGNFSKSGSFTAFAAHACAVVSRMKSGGEPFAHLIRPEEVAPAVQRKDFAEFERRGFALREWYLRESDWPVVAGRIRQMYEGGL